MSATVSRAQAGGWLRVLLRGGPHQIVGPADRPYLLRWFVLPHNTFVNVYVHKFTGSDEPEALHDHPWWFASLVVSGGYVEHTAAGPRRRGRGSVAFRSAQFRHRIELPAAGGRRAVCRTLVLTGPKRRTWGFWCARDRFVAWDQFSGGCGEEPEHA
jgi:hypothetical protein